MNDQELLQAFASTGDPDAFAELVRRNMALVYGSALRRVGDPDLAQEISQETFCALINGAKSIRDPAALAGWLYRTTANIARMRMRSEQRRRHREDIAAIAMNESNARFETNWEEISERLEPALERLPESDRVVILLRYFQSKPFAQVAVALGITEAAAKMRVSRAVEKLRTYLGVKNAALTAPALALLLERNAAQAAPGHSLTEVLKATSAAISESAAVTVTGGRSLGAIGQMVGKPSTTLLLALATLVILTPILISISRPPGVSNLNENLAAANHASDRSVEVGPAVASNLPKPSGKTLALRLEDEETSRPLEGVEVSSGFLGTEFSDWISSAEGIVQVPVSIPEDASGFYFRIRARKEGYATQVVSWSRFQHDHPDDIPAEYTLRLSRGIQIGGLVVDERRQPKPGVEISIQSFASGDPPPRARALLNDGSRESVYTDQFGRWTFNRLPEDWRNLRFRISSNDSPEVVYITDANDQGLVEYARVSQEKLIAGEAVLHLYAGLELSGFVVDENGRPVSQARLVLDFKWHDPGAQVLTGVDGAFRFLNIPSGPVNLSVQAEGFAPRAVPLDMGQALQGLTIRLERGAFIQGRIVNENGTGIEGAEIKALATGPLSFQWSTTTGADGAFSWNSAPKEPFEVEVRKQGFQRTRAVIQPGSENRIVLPPIQKRSILITANVTDQQNSPIKEFQVLVSEDNSKGLPQIGRSGGFSMNLETQARQIGLEIRAHGFAPAEENQAIGPDNFVNFSFKLRRDAGYSGMVLLPDGTPAANAEVGFAGHSRGLILGNRRFLFPEDSIITRTDSEGNFKMRPVRHEQPSGRFLIAVHEQGYAELNAEEAPHDAIVMKLQPWGRIHGILMAHGKPLAETSVKVGRRFLNPWTHGVFLWSETYSCITDSKGQFTFENLPPGHYSVGRFEIGRPFDCRATVTLGSGETVRIEMGGDGSAVTGRVNLENFPPEVDLSRILGGALLTRVQANPVDSKQERIAYWQSPIGIAAWLEQRTYSIQLNPDGSFHAEDVPPGDYIFKLFARVAGKGSWRLTSPLTIPAPTSEHSVADVGLISLAQENSWD
jgi:RNA polymerase sigma factor (sigma-70 family)